MSYEKVKKGVDKETEKVMKVLVPLARDIIKILASRDLVLGNADQKEIEDFYYNVSEEVLKLIAERDIPFASRHLLFQLVSQAVENTRDITLNALEESYKRCTNKLFGKEFMDLKLSDLDKVLKS